MKAARRRSTSPTTTRSIRDVAFALIKTEGLDETSRVRVKREAQAMGQYGNTSLHHADLRPR